MSIEKNIIITGSNRGIGFAIVKKFAENGCNVWACARKFNADFETQIAALAEQNGVWIKPIYFELTDEAAIKAAITEIFKEKKPVHTLINNAGVYFDKLFQMHTMKEIREIFDVNILSMMYITQLVLKMMARQKEGNIINIASVTGLTPHLGAVCYGSATAAVAMFTQSLAIEAAHIGKIRVNAIAPGHTDTGMIGKISDKDLQHVINNCILKRLALPSEIADVAYFLSNDEASFINGQVIRVDGGESHGK